MANSETDRHIIAALDDIEWHVVRKMRELRKHGYGSLTVECVNSNITRCLLTTGDDPAFLRQVQQVGGTKPEEVSVDIGRYILIQQYQEERECSTK